MGKQELVKASVSKHQFAVVLETELFTLRKLAKVLVKNGKASLSAMKESKVDVNTLEKTVNSIKRLSIGITEPMSDDELDTLTRNLTMDVMTEMMKTPGGTKQVIKDITNSLKGAGNGNGGFPRDNRND